MENRVFCTVFQRKPTTPSSGTASAFAPLIAFLDLAPFNLLLAELSGAEVGKKRSGEELAQNPTTIPRFSSCNHPFSSPHNLHQWVHSRCLLQYIAASTSEFCSKHAILPFFWNQPILLASNLQFDSENRLFRENDHIDYLAYLTSVISTLLCCWAENAFLAQLSAPQIVPNPNFVPPVSLLSTNKNFGSGGTLTVWSANHKRVQLLFPATHQLCSDTRQNAAHNKTGLKHKATYATQREKWDYQFKKSLLILPLQNHTVVQFGLEGTFQTHPAPPLYYMLGVWYVRQALPANFSFGFAMGHSPILFSSLLVPTVTCRDFPGKLNCVS